jgi:hypothetical protein
MYSFLGVIIAFSFLDIIKNKDTFFSCPARIETFSITFSALTLSPARAVDKFSAILSASAKSLA